MPRFVLALARGLLLVAAVAGCRARPVPLTPPVPAPAPAAAPSAAEATPPTTPPALPAPTPPPQPTQDPAGAGEGPPKGEPSKPTSRRGIPVDDLLVHTHCSRCHELDGKQQMTRISYVRKSPEGWAETIKRMIRLNGVQISPTDAKALVRSLANSHGLARSEAERGLYESERRVHWSEEAHDQDFRRACAECHPLGRVLLQQRDEEEWQLLRATHVAMFPLARGQMGGGPPEDEMRRFGGPPPGAGGAGAGGGQGGRRGGTGEPPAPTQSVGDRVLGRLAKEQPLFTPAWEKWTKNRREVPLAGRWTVTGHETGKGDLVGTADLVRTEADEYDVVWTLTFGDGSTVVRRGKGLLYAGYSWRGRSAEAGEQPAQWREVLLLDEAWQTFRGRLFTGTHDEIGADVTLHRDQQRPRVLAVGNGAIAVPTTGHPLLVHGEGFPATVAPTDLFVGSGLTVRAIERTSDRLLRVILDAAAGAELGPRTIAFGSEPGLASVQLYDTVDYVRIAPLQGLARIGGARHPRQLERFEAFAVHRGADEKPYTDDDVTLFPVQPRWALAEFAVRDDDDDVGYVGAIDAATGVFTPNVDGPNPARKWSANNIGDVFVTAELELEVPVRPAPKPAAKPGEPPAAVPGPPPAAPAGPPARERKTFFARSHLLVTVPLYVRWQVLDWEDR